MTLALIVYLAGVLSKITAFFAIIATVLAVASFMSFGCSVDYHAHSERAKDLRKTGRKYFVYACIPFFICFTVPSEKTMYMMAGAYAAQQVAENPNVQRISGKVINIIDQKLDDIMKEGVAKIEEKVK